MILTAQEMKSIEAAAFARGVQAEALMEQAGLQIAQAVAQFFPRPGDALVFYGKGHNGGDALVAARHLAAGGWRIALRPAFAEGELAELTREKLGAMKSVSVGANPGRPLVILDGLLGIGASGALRGPILAATREINRLRRDSGAHVFSIDLPTGLDTDTGKADPDCVVADCTLTIGFAKTGLVADGAANFVGRLAVLPLEALGTREEPPRAGSRDLVATAPLLAPLLPRRKFDTHKTNYGRVGIVAGSIGMTGAAVMTAEAALRAGSGLVTLFATSEIYRLLAAVAPPEIMVRPVDSYADIAGENLDVLAIGPGLGRAHDEDVLRLIETAPLPMVVDADALNALSMKTELLNHAAGPRLLTPHPGEMARLFSSGGKTRAEIVDAFTEKFPVTLLLKGARTLVGEHGQPRSYNTTGGPGMATGGMGDVLTGICAALLAQGLAPFDAARLGAWLHGRAAEIAIFHGTRSDESLTATDLFDVLGTAFKQLRTGCF